METASWTATLFSGGTVVATLNGFADGFDAGETVTVEFFGFDEYAGWDTIEFQVDFEVWSRRPLGGPCRRPNPEAATASAEAGFGRGGDRRQRRDSSLSNRADDAGCRWLR